MSRTLTVRKGFKVLAAVAALAAATVTTTVVATPTAAAAGAVVTCTGQENVSWSPALTNTPRDTMVTINGRLGALGSPGACVSVGAGVDSAQYQEIFTFPNDSCTTAGLAVPGSRLITWDDGETSTFTFSATIVNGIGSEVVTLTGTISEGRFAGTPAVETVQVPQLNPLLCAGPGATSVTGQAELELLPV